MLNLEKTLIENGYNKQAITGTYFLIGAEEIKKPSKIFIYNLNNLCNCKEYLNKYKNSLNKVELINDGITVYSKGELNLEVKAGKLFTYIN